MWNTITASINRNALFTSQTQATCSWVNPKLGRGLCLGGGGLYGGVVPDPGAPYPPKPADNIVHTFPFIKHYSSRLPRPSQHTQKYNKVQKPKKSLERPSANRWTTRRSTVQHRKTIPRKISDVPILQWNHNTNFVCLPNYCDYELI